MGVRRIIATSVITGREIEIFEPVVDELAPISSDSDDDDRDRRLINHRVMLRMMFGAERPGANLELR